MSSLKYSILASGKGEKVRESLKDSLEGVQTFPNLGEDEIQRHILDHLFQSHSYETHNIQQGCLSSKKVGIAVLSSIVIYA
jgi:hypothetical protein